MTESFRASKRIVGTSAERETPATVNFTAPYDSSSSWTTQGSWWSIDTTNQEADFSGGTNSSNRIRTSLGLTLNNSLWICDFTFKGGSAYRSAYVVVLSDGTNYPSNNSDNIIFWIDTSGTTHIYSDGNTSSSATTLSTNTTYYIRLERTTSTNVKLRVFSGAARTDDLQVGSTINQSVSESVDGLDTLQHASDSTGGSGSGGNWSVSNLKIYNNQSSTNNTNNLSNAQTNSIFSETDTGKDFIYDGSVWTEVA